MAAPVFAEDLTKTRRAGLLNIVLNTTMAMVPLMLIGDLLGGKSPRLGMILEAAVFFVCLILRMVMSRGHVDFAGYGLITSVLVLLTAGVASMGTVNTPAAAGYIVLIVVAGLLFRTAVLVGTTSLCSLAILALVLAERSGLMVPKHLDATAAEWLMYTAYFGLSAGIVYFSARWLGHALVMADHEISDRRRAEEKLTRSRAEFEAMFNALTDAVVFANPSHEILMVNPAFTRMFGYGADEVLGKRTSILQTDSNAVPTARKWDDTDGIDASRPFETWYRCKDGRRVPTESIGIPVKDPGGRVIGFLGVHRDITARREAETALRQSEERFRALTESSLDTIMRFDRGHRHLYVNPAVTKLTQIPPSEFLGRTHGEMGFPRDLVEKWEAAIDQVFETGDPHRIEFQLPSQFWVDWQLMPEFAPDGTVTAVITSARDITKIREAGQALRDSQRQLAEIIDFLPDATFVVDLGGKVLAWNRAMEDLTGVPAGSILGKGGYEYALPFYGERRPILVDYLLQEKQEPDPLIYPHVRREGETFFGELAIRNLRNRGPAHLLVKTATLRDSAGNLTGAIETIRDITFRWKTEQALRESEARLRTVVTNAPVVLFALEETGDFTLLEGKGLSALGLSQAEVAGKSVFEVFADEPEIVESVKRAYAGETSHAVVKIGSLVFETWYSPVIDAHGRTCGVIGVATDMTERRKAEAELEETTQRLSLAKSAGRIGIWDLDIMTGRVVLDERMLEIYGLSPAEFEDTYEAWISRIHPEDRRDVQMGIDAALASQDEFHAEFRIIRPSGRVRDVEAHAVVTRAAGGPPVRMTGVHIDISLRKQMEQALRQSEERLHLIVEAAPMPLLLSNPLTGQILGTNQALCTLSGYTRERLATMTVSELYADPERDRAAVIKELKEHGRVFQHDMNAVRADGMVVNVLLSAEFIEFGNEPVTLSVVYDLTERKRMEQELKRAKEAAEAASKAKSIFLANMSHELRTPLTAILGFSELIALDPSLTQRQRSNVEAIRRGGEHLLALINDVLQLSKIEAGQIALVEDTFDLHQLLDGLREMFAIRADQKGLHLSLERASVVPRYIKSDQNRLREVLINLIGNAIKFTERGNITLRTSVLEAGPGDGEPSGKRRIRFEVEDSGVGIHSNDYSRIFDAFVQAARGDRAHQGTGLGLTISREFVRMMGGDITVESKLNHGSRFSFEILAVPADPPEPASAEGAERVIGLEPGQPIFRILVAEDAEPARRLLVDLLTSVGFVVDEVSNGREAVEMCEKSPPDLVFMDIRMPLMDGLDATAWIRASQGDRKLVIVALTAEVFEEEHDSILAAGCDDIVLKPYRIRDIFAALVKHLGVRFLEAHADKPGRGAQDHLLREEDLAVLPVEWQNELRQAALAANQEWMLDLIGQIRGSAPGDELAQALEHLVDSFEHEKILVWLGQSQN